MRGRSRRIAGRKGRAPSTRAPYHLRPAGLRTSRSSRPLSSQPFRRKCRRAATPSTTRLCHALRRGRKNAAAGSPSAAAIPPEGTAPAVLIAATHSRRSASGCPSINPYFRYCVVALHQRGPQLEWSFVSDRMLIAQSPAAGYRVWLGDDVFDLGFFSCDIATYAAGVDRFEPLSNQIEDKDTGVVAFRADTCSGESRQRGDLGGVGSPMKTVGVGMLALGLQRSLRSPEAGNIVVDLFPRRNFNQLNRALPPISDRFGPKTRPLFELGFQVLIRIKVLLPLHQAVTARIEIGETADLQISGIAERAPQFLAAAVIDRQPVGIVDRRSKVIHVGTIIGPEEEHACHRHQAGMIEIDTRIDGHLDIEHRGVAWTDGEAISRGGAWTV